MTMTASVLIALLVAGVIVHRFHSRLTVGVMSVLLGVALAVVALGYLWGVVPLVVGLFVGEMERPAGVRDRADAAQTNGGF